MKINRRCTDRRDIRCFIERKLTLSQFVQRSFQVQYIKEVEGFTNLLVTIVHCKSVLMSKSTVRVHHYMPTKMKIGKKTYHCFFLVLELASALFFLTDPSTFFTDKSPFFP